MSARPGKGQFNEQDFESSMEQDDEFIEPGESPSPASAEMDAMMEQYLDRMPTTVASGQLLQVPIIALRPTHALVDVGEKAEGLVALNELQDANGEMTAKVGDVIDVIVKGQDAENGMMILSHLEARRRKAMELVTKSLKDKAPIAGKVVRAVKGGLIVDIGTTAFLPASQVDLRRVDNFEAWVGQPVECVVIEHVPEQRRIILSRRKWMEDQEHAKRDVVMGKLAIGQVIEGAVKRIVDFGAFVDLGGIDGLIPRSEISWHRMAKPEDYVKLGEVVRVKIIDMDKGQGRVTLSRRQLQPDPWTGAKERYPAGATVEGEIVSITNYGAFVRLEEGLDGMIHISDMAWDSAGKQPNQYVTVTQRVQAIVQSVDTGAKRISLGLKQLTTDPWADLEVRYPSMTRIKGKVTGITKYGAFIELEPGIEGMVHVSDFSWDKRVNHPNEMLKKGDETEACVLKIDRDQRRISLGIKQLTVSPVMQYSYAHHAGEPVEGEVTSVNEFGVTLKLADGIEGFIHVSHLEKGRIEAPIAPPKVGDVLTAEILKIDVDAGKVSLSRKQYLKKEERRLLANYSKKSSGSGGTNLGELLSELALDDDLPKE